MEVKQPSVTSINHEQDFTKVILPSIIAYSHELFNFCFQLSYTFLVKLHLNVVCDICRI